MKMIHAALKKYVNRHEIVKSLMDAIHKKEVQLKPFSMFDNYAFANVRAYMIKHDVLNDGNNNRENVIRLAQKEYYGWIYGNNLYYRDGLRGRELVHTIVHEYVHWLRKQHNKFRYGTHREIFIEEALAELIARSIFKNRTNTMIEDVTVYIIDKYKLNVDPKRALHLLHNHVQVFEQLV